MCMTGPTRILVVDDEPQIHRFLRPGLTASGFEVIAADTAAMALKAAATQAPALVILDLGLPDRDGKEVITEIRAWSKMPIIVLSARDRETEKIAALDLGADDYINKPFGIGELLARIRAALRHSAQDANETTSFRQGGLQIDTLAHKVTLNGDPVRLTPKEYELLHILVRSAGRVITHRQILSAVWGPAHTSDTQDLRVFIGQLRAKIEPDPSNPSLIITEPGVGYRFADAQE
jgi:two-component system, OmpR family, KDP operon response regulator KdpE